MRIEPIGDKIVVKRLEAEVSEFQARAAPGLALHSTALLLAVLNFLRHQHNCDSL